MRALQPLLAVEFLVANDGWVASPVKAVSRRRRGPQARLYRACDRAILGHRGRRLATQAQPGVSKPGRSTDARGDEVFGGLLEDRAPFLAVRAQQGVAPPALQSGGQFPPEIGGVFEPVIEAVGAVGRVAVRGIAGDEGAPDLVPVGDGDAQVPEADVVEFAREVEAGDLLDQAVEIEIVLGGITGTGAWKNNPSPTSMRPKNCQ